MLKAIAFQFKKYPPSMATHWDNRPVIGGPPPVFCGMQASLLYPGKLVQYLIHHQAPDVVRGS